MIDSETVLTVGDWVLDRLENDDGEDWWVLRKSIGEDTDISIPFDSVHATGSLIILKRGDTNCITINGALSGRNTYAPQTSVPVKIVNKLQEIGPW